jgi:uncharacterized membrane protein
MAEQITITILAAAGFAVSFYIHYHKSRNMHLACIVGDKNCNKVVNSGYSKFMGVNNEIWGMIYYGFVMFIYLSSLSFPVFQIQYVAQVIGVIISAAVLFSAYLLFMQLFIIKELCEWCLVSAGISIIIFILFII